jgi:cytochrome oxidase assembly protein ShyY1
VLLRNRPNSTQAASAGPIGTGGNSQNGYEVVVPLRTTDGAVLFVDRGWIPAGSKDALHPDSVPAVPTGQVTVVARLRPSEEATTRRAPAGQAIRLNVPALTRETGVGADGRVVGAFGALVSENPQVTDTPTPTDPPDSSTLGINLSYFVQWEAFAVVAYVLFGVAMVREVRRRDEEEEDALEGLEGGKGPDDDETDEEPPAIIRATYR